MLKSYTLNSHLTMVTISIPLKTRIIFQRNKFSFAVTMKIVGISSKASTEKNFKYILILYRFSFLFPPQGEIDK